MFTQPEAYKEWKEKRNSRPEEADLAGVTYEGESEAAFAEFEKYGLLEPPVMPGV
jgi:hypothetical protein